MIALLGQAAPPAALPSPPVVWSLLWPFMILAVGGVLLVTITSVVPVLRGRGFPAAFTCLAALASGLSLIPVWQRVNRLDVFDSVIGSGTEGPRSLVSGAYAVDGFTVFVTGVICVSVFLASLLLDGYLRREGLDGPEWYVLMLMSASGGVLLTSANDLIVSFLGLEILSIAAYVMAALHLRRADSQEAGFKYFVLGALASAIFLYGIAMVYGATGSTTLQGIFAAGPNAAGLDPRTDSSLILAGMALLLVGFAFKVSAVPFHFWAPDVYQGAPSPVVAFMASAVKVAAFAGLARIFLYAFQSYWADWRPMVAALAVLSVIGGALLALAQRNVKRMLAYSSINHAGFMLLAIHAAASPDDGGQRGAEALLFYLLAYTVMVAGTFGVATIVGGLGDGRHDLDDYRGLSRSNPVLAGAMAILLFSQAGVPFTSGFFAKFRVIGAVASDGSYALGGIAMLAAVVSAVLYLRIVVSMFLVDNGEAHDADHEAVAAVDGGSAGPSAEGDTLVEASPEAAVLAPVRAPAPTAVIAVCLAAAVTLVLGLLPDLGGGVLRDAAAALLLAG